MSSNRDMKENSGIEIDRFLHEPSRLKILAQLYVVKAADYIFIMKQTGLTQGNISGQLQKLEQAELVEIEKKYLGKRPYTMVSLTSKGREAMQLYIENLNNLLAELDPVQHRDPKLGIQFC